MKRVFLLLMALPLVMGALITGQRVDIFIGESSPFDSLEVEADCDACK